MYVKLNQVVLGSYVSTYLYCLLVLNAVRDSNDHSFIPSISILMAILAAMANIILLIVFIHQIAVSIQADKVISDISDFISKQVKTLFPEKLGEEKEGDIHYDAAISSYKIHTSIKSSKSGYLQYIDSKALIKDVSGNDALLELYYRPGNYFVKGMDIGILYSNTNVDEDVMEDLLDHFIIGKIKTAEQDLEFSIHQMVEIAARALSAGVNDPYTAIACIDYLTTTLCYLAQAQFPSKYRFDEEGFLRIKANVLDFEGVLDAAFNQIRQFSTGSTAVIIRLMEALTILLEFTKKENYKIAVIRHVEMVLAKGEGDIKEQHDLDDLKKRADKILGN